LGPRFFAKIGFSAVAEGKFPLEEVKNLSIFAVSLSQIGMTRERYLLLVQYSAP
jgi:hypothetical protein